MNYQERIEALFERTPSYQNVGKDAYKPGLESMLAFDNVAGHPHLNFPTVHIAGTNGKGSVSSMLAAALSYSGRKVGLYTSPHLTDFRERARIVTENGFELISREEVISFLDRFDDFISEAAPSFFEITTAMAFDFFASHQVDVAVIETGLGGRLDSTNIITPRISVITNIGLEHCAMLGNTLSEIAFEKAGIIKSGVPVVIGESHPETRPVFEKKAAEYRCPITFAEERQLPQKEYLLNNLDLKGQYQSQNLQTVLTALEVLGMEYDETRIAATARHTGFRGRWEKLSSKPDIICDIGHNAHGLKEVFGQLAAVRRDYRRVHIVFGVVSDKDVEAVARCMLLPDNATDYIFTSPSTQRAMPVGELVSRLAPFGIHGKETASVGDALDLAISDASEDDLIFVGGSNFTVSDALDYFEKRPADF